MLKKWLLALFCFVYFSYQAFAQQQTKNGAAEIEGKIDALMSKMTLEEKVGQLNQYTGDRLATGPVSPSTTKFEDIEIILMADGMGEEIFSC